MVHTLMFDEFDEFNYQNLSILIGIRLPSNRRCKKPRNPILSVIDSILLEAWIFLYFLLRNSFQSKDHSLLLLLLLQGFNVLSIQSPRAQQ